MDVREKVDSLLASIADIDLDALAETTLFTVPIGKSCIITKVVMRNIAGAGIPIDTASVSFGFNTGDADDVIANAVQVLTDATNYEVIPPKSDAVRGAAGDVFKIDVNTAEGAAITVTVDVFGYLF